MAILCIFALTSRPFNRQNFFVTVSCDGGFDPDSKVFSRSPGRPDLGNFFIYCYKREQFLNSFRSAAVVDIAFMALSLQRHGRGTIFIIVPFTIDSGIWGR